MKANHFLILGNWAGLGLIVWQTNWIVAVGVVITVLCTFALHKLIEHDKT